MNLRGVKESGTVFAVPTYGFIVCIGCMLAVGLMQLLTGHTPVSESAGYEPIATEHVAGLLLVGLVLRAFASGCTALTGVEAVSNGVPSFRRPKSRNAASTLLIMGCLTIAMFVGITAFALVTKVHMAADGVSLAGAPEGYQQRTAIAQIAGAIFGYQSVGFFAVQAFTAAILIMAANTAFNGFPILASLLGEDGFLPRQFARRGDRLVFSNGIVILAVLAMGLIWAFHADTSRLIQLYILGVFLSFTLSQAGMVRHWNDELRRDQPGSRSERAHIHRARIINGFGAVLTALVLVVVLATKFTHGAWIVVIAMPLLFMLMTRIERHYANVAEELSPPPGGVVLPSRIHAIVLVSKLHTPTLRALAFARATKPDTITALTVRTNPAETDALVEDWGLRGVPMSLTVLDSPYRDVTRPVLDHIESLHRMSPRDVVSVFIPEYVSRRWWQHLLHNQSALRLKARLLFQPGVMVTNVPWQLGDESEFGRAVAVGREDATVSE